MPQDKWNPVQYNKFERERSQPFYDLLALIRPEPDMHVIDLGCGTGQLTKVLHEKLQAKHTLGIDTSPAMLQEAKKLSSNGLTFIQKDILEIDPTQHYDLIFSNAALQWLPDHHKLFPFLIKQLRNDGQLAIQVPANFDFPTHTIAKELSGKYKAYLQEAQMPSALTIEEYSSLLFQNGLKNQIVKAQIYPLALPSSKELIEWLKGSLLTFFEKYLPPDAFQEFMHEYTIEIEKTFGKNKSIFVPFKRILMWATNTGINK